jgi:hypothetical protein
MSIPLRPTRRTRERRPDLLPLALRANWAVRPEFAYAVARGIWFTANGMPFVPCNLPQARPDLRRVGKRGYGAARQRPARAVIAAHPWCELCGASSDLTADHLTALASGRDPLGAAAGSLPRLQTRGGARNRERGQQRPVAPLLCPY